MAKSLNKTRVRDTKLILIIAVLMVVFIAPTFEDEGILHELFDFTGYFLVSICALGRVYATAFLGGHKNKKLITDGPFSVVRNPLYTFSLIGITGIAFITNNIFLMIGLPIIFVVMYHYLVQREEAFLITTFGEEYKSYLTNVPRFIPNFKLYQTPEETVLSPQLLKNALFDAIWWFAFFPIIELIEYLQETQIVPTYQLF